MKKGFSLIEIMVAVTIIALLAVGTVISLANLRVRSRETRRINDVGQIGDALDSYETLTGGLPTGTGYATKYLTALVDQGVLKNIPDDPYPADSTATNLCGHYYYSYDKTSSWSFKGKTIGHRSYIVEFGSEMIGDSQLVNPLNNNLVTQNAHDACNGARSTGYLLGQVVPQP